MLRNLSFLLLPARCLLCLAPGSHGIDLCRNCKADLPWITCACPRCGLPMALPGPACRTCWQAPPPFQQCIAPLRYATPVDRMIQAFKQGNLLFGHTLAQLITPEVMKGARPDVLVPVPLHPSRRRSRGFNQALEISRVIAADTGIPLDPALCQRIINTPAQRLLNRQQRQKNLRGAFIASTRAAGQHVGLVDDVVTTGATVSEIATTLLRAGATAVSVFALARTPFDV
ncbi:MAG: ComF family protein [Pseudomonadota bacterium]